MSDLPLRATPEPPEPVVDWRGTPITPGALVIYGGPVGRSIQMVEARVADPMLSPSGRIFLNVVRRSYTDDNDGRVHVGADRLTVVAELPPTTLPTASEVKDRNERRYQAMNAHRDGLHKREEHTGPPSGYVRRTSTYSGWRGPQTREWDDWVRCEQCDASTQAFLEAWDAAEETRHAADHMQAEGIRRAAQ
jgi:hypothetical protein